MVLTLGWVEVKMAGCNNLIRAKGNARGGFYFLCTRQGLTRLPARNHYWLPPKSRDAIQANAMCRSRFCSAGFAIPICTRCEMSGAGSCRQYIRASRGMRLWVGWRRSVRQSKSINRAILQRSAAWWMQTAPARIARMALSSFAQTW